MQVLKFGGTSIADATSILRVLKIIEDRTSNSCKIGVVLSAVSGVTNFLVESTENCYDSNEIKQRKKQLLTKHLDIVFALRLELDQKNNRKLIAKIFILINLFEDLLLKFIKNHDDKTYCQILSIGERLSAHIITRLIKSKLIKIRHIDSQDFIKTSGLLKKGDAVITAIANNFMLLDHSKFQIILMSGFIGSNESNDLSLLGRNGSDYSAALMALGLKAKSCEVWTDVDGIYTGDPNQISAAKLIAEMSYEEATELAFYGAKVLHPMTAKVLSNYGIDLYIKNTFNPATEGTKVSNILSNQQTPLVRGLSCIANVSLVYIKIYNETKIQSVIDQIHMIASNYGFIIVFTNSESPSELCFCAHGENVSSIFKKELIKDENIDVNILHNKSVVSIVGEHLSMQKDICKKFFSYFTEANIIILAKNLSHKCLAAVIDSSNKPLAYHQIHSLFFS